jgi:hypothetical protein
MILDYNEVIERNGIKGVEYREFRESNLELFYSNNQICPICKTKLEIIYSADSGTLYPDWLDGSFREYENVYKCQSCGWWEYRYNNSSDAMLEFTRLQETKIRTAILKEYEISDKNVPIITLENYIRKNPDKIYHIHHKKMEELTQSIFSDFYNCDVELVGKSADGGIDLLYIESDNPKVVQVKRRTKPDAVESASYIRELLGATLLKDSRACTFVTTADHFSKQAKKHAIEAVKKNIVDEIELIDFHRFVDMLKLTKTKDEKLWKKFLSVERNEKFTK